MVCCEGNGNMDSHLILDKSSIQINSIGRFISESRATATRGS